MYIQYIHAYIYINYVSLFLQTPMGCYSLSPSVHDGSDLMAMGKNKMISIIPGHLSYPVFSVLLIQVMLWPRLYCL